MSDHDKVIDYLRENGPSHPVQVGKVLEKDIFTSSAILQECVNSKRVKRTEKKVGGSPLYYIPGQEGKVKKMVEDSLKPVEKKVLGQIKERGFAYQDEMGAQARFILNELKDLIVPLKARIGGEERVIWKYHSIGNEDIEKEILPKKEQKEEQKDDGREKRVSREEAPAQREFEDLGEVIGKLGARIVKKEKKKRTEVNYIIEMKSLPRQKYLLKHRDKKRINESDLSLLYTEGMEKKMPCIMVTSGKMTKKAREKKKEFGDLLFVLRI